MKLLRYGIALERLGQRYRLDGVLGSGGMADVCLAWDEREQREVAIKVIKSQELDQRTVDRFLKEASQVARWRHPHVVRIYGNARLELLDRSQGIFVPYIVMEYAQNGDLHKRLRSGMPFPFAQTLSVFEQVCQAVSFAHTQGVIHRDLKPLNILFRALPAGGEQALLSDFGLAVEKDATHFTFAAGGTLPYMAPEQLQGRAQAASDIFALGVILYQLCTGRLPFRRSLVDLRSRAPMKPPIPPSQLFELLPPDLDGVILQALAEDPRQRYADALDFWNAVQEVVSASTVDIISRQQTLHQRQTSSASRASAASIWRPDIDAHHGLAPEALAPLDEASDYDLLLDSAPDSAPRSNANPAAYTSSRQPRNTGYKNSATVGRIPRRTSRAPGTAPQHAMMSSDAGATSTRKAPRPAAQTSQPLPSRSRRRGLTIGLLCSALLILGLFLVLLTPIIPGLHALGGITSFLGSASNPTGPTITIVPSSRTITDSYELQTVAANADPRQLQITAHTIKATHSQTQTARATGHTQTQGTAAKGTLTFLNGAFISQTVAAGTIFTTKDGIQITNDDTVVMQAAIAPNLSTTTVAAHAINLGANGNIPNLAINQTCCKADNSVFVKNTSPFTGGQGPADYSFIQQGDVDGVVNPLTGTLTQQARNDLNGQLKANERLAGQAECARDVTVNKADVGDQGHSVASTPVTVTETCTATAYDQNSAQRIASSRLQQKASGDPGTGYAQAGTITSTIANVTHHAQATSIQINARGTWVYQFSPQRRQQLLQLVAGKSSAAAQTLLKQQNGVANVFIHLKEDNTTTLPTDPASINIQIQDIQVPPLTR